jgi:hypothetical protein
MAGKIKAMIEEIVSKRSNGNSTIRNITITKIILKGINPDLFTSTSADDPNVIGRLRQIATELGVTVQ